MHRMRLGRVIFAILMFSAFVSLNAQQDTIRTRVDLVVVPASVRDSNGKFVYDLRPEEFQVLEDGRAQDVQNFSVDPLPLSVAVLIDTGLGGTAMRRVADSSPSLSAGLTDVDEAEIYRFDHIISKISDFTNSPEELEKKLGPIKKMAQERVNRPSPLVILPGRGPRWLRRLLLLDSGVEYKNLNDVLFMSALDLEARPVERRKIVMIISDGQVADDANWFHAGTTIHSVEETQERLIRSQIQVYGVSVGNALLTGPTSILHFYADATGGDIHRAGSQNAMETACSRILEQARHQYVLSYVSNNEVPGMLAVTRTIEVKTNRPNLEVNHRKSYLQYPLPR